MRLLGKMFEEIALKEVPILNFKKVFLLRKGSDFKLRMLEKHLNETFRKNV